MYEQEQPVREHAYRDAANAEETFAATVRSAYAVPEPSLSYEARLNALATAAKGQAKNSDRGRGAAEIFDRVRRIGIERANRRNIVARWGWLTAGVAGAAGIASIAYLTLLTGKADARALITRVTQAGATVKTAYIKQWRPLNGSRETTREFWYSASVGANGAWREDDGAKFSVILQRDHRFYFHWLTRNRVDVSETPANLPPLSASERLKRLSEAGLLDRVSLLPDAMVDGKPAKRLLITLPDNPPNTEPAFYGEATPLREIIAVDPQTDLPFRSITEAFHQGEWRPVRFEDAAYNKPVDPARFSTEFPGATVISPEVARAESLKEERKRLIDSAIRVPVGKYAVTLRLFDATELGDVYILYSAQPGSPLPRVELQDQTKRVWRYQGGGMVGRRLPELAEKWTFPDGERLCIAWFRNEQPMTNEQSGDWKVRFHFDGPDGGISPEVRPGGGRMSGKAIPDDDFYREIIQESPTLLAAACRDRAAAFRDGRWRDDGPLLNIALAGQLSPNQQATYWEAEAGRIEKEAQK